MKYTVEDIKNATRFVNNNGVITIRTGKQVGGEVIVEKRWRWIAESRGEDAFVITEGINLLFRTVSALEDHIYEKLAEKMSDEFTEELSLKLAARFGQKEG